MLIPLEFNVPLKINIVKCDLVYCLRVRILEMDLEVKYRNYLIVVCKQVQQVSMKILSFLLLSKLHKALVKSSKVAVSHKFILRSLKGERYETDNCSAYLSFLLLLTEFTWHSRR